jgi:hypothetical protein
VTALDLKARNLAHLRSAVLQLVGAGPVKQRLCDASLTHLRDVDPAGLPGEVTEAYVEIMESLSTVPATCGLGSIGATVRKMSDPQAASCAARILDLYLALSAGELREPAMNPQPQLRLVRDD